MILSFKVRNDDQRERNGVVYPREAELAEHIIEQQFDASVRGVGPGGLNGLSSAINEVAMKVWKDEAIRKDWAKVPVMPATEAAQWSDPEA